jgi:lysophospholipase L1-like esterase
MFRARILVVLVAGCVAAACAKNPNEPSTADVRYTAVGASDAIGVGSTVVCVPFTSCPDGMGYVPVIGRRFQATGRPVTIVNLGIPGAVLGPEIEQIGNALGRGIPGNFLEREAPFVPSNSTLVTMFAGGNDANTIAAALAAGFGGSDLEAYVRDRVANFGRDYRALVDTIRGRAAGAQLIALNLPNLAGLPYASGRTLEERRWLQRISVGLSAEVNALTGSDVMVIDLMCDGSFYDAFIYSNDGFHPNNIGHARIADLLFNAANSSSHPAPLADCGAMRLF